MVLHRGAQAKIPGSQQGELGGNAVGRYQGNTLSVIRPLGERGVHVGIGTRKFKKSRRLGR